MTPVPITSEWLKRRLAAWKAEKGLNWQQIAERMSTFGSHVTAGSLMSKHSRGSFTALEFIGLLQVLGVESFDVPEPSPLGVTEQGQTMVDPVAHGRSGLGA